MVFFLGSLHQPWILFHSTQHTGGGACTEDGGGHVAASCLGCDGCLYGEDGGSGLAASSWGFPWVCKLRVSSKDGGGVLAASLSPLVMDLGSGVGDGPVRMAVGFSSPRSGVSLAFANRVYPARMAVVLTPPLLAYGCCGWVCSSVCRQRQRWWSSRHLALCFSWPVGGDDGAVPVIVAVRSSLSGSHRHPGHRHPV